MTNSLRNGLLFGLLPAFCFALAACSGSEASDDSEDEGALEQAEQEAEDAARSSVQGIISAKCEPSFLGESVALSRINYKKLPADYEGKSAADKQAILKANIEEAAYPSDCRPDAGFGYIGKSVISLLVGGLDKTWTTSADEMPAGRVKFLRPFGAAATFDFETVESTPFTGVLKGGDVVKGIVRFSNVGKEDKAGFVPGAAFKFLVDGKPSVNTVAMYSLLPQKLDGQLDRNFFRYPHANWFPSLSAQARIDSVKAPVQHRITQSIFELAFGNEPNRMEVDELAALEASGRAIPKAERKYPRNLAFRPTREITARYQAALEQNPQLDYRDFLATVEPGTVVYEAFGAETDEHSDYGVKIGAVRLTSKVTRSAWADYRLFFKHSAKNSKHEKDY